MTRIQTHLSAPKSKPAPVLEELSASVNHIKPPPTDLDWQTHYWELVILTFLAKRIHLKNSISSPQYQIDCKIGTQNKIQSRSNEMISDGNPQGDWLSNRGFLTDRNILNRRDGREAGSEPARPTPGCGRPRGRSSEPQRPGLRTQGSQVWRSCKRR